MRDPPPPSSGSTRRLAALWFADVVGYSALAARDEDAALHLIDRFQQVCRHAVESEEGRLVKFLGDGALAEFRSTEAAARSALKLQRAFSRTEATASGSPSLRIGVHVGDVVSTSDHDLYGDGVNTALRLQVMAEPDQIILSGEARRHLAHRREFQLHYLGDRSLKGLLEPVAAYCLQVGAAGPLANDPAAEPSIREFPRPSGFDRPKPSLAVLPFANLSSDPENEYFSDGITEDLLTALAQIRELRVAARTSSFAFKQRQQDVREVGRKLGVQVVLEGSVRKAGNRLRVTAQLVSTQDGYHLWSEHYDRDLHDIFALQDELARTIVDSLLAELTDEGQNSLVQQPTGNLEAYDVYLRGRSHLHQMTTEGLEAALDCFARAVALDPRFARAHASAASTCVAYSFYGPGKRQPRELWEQARRASTEALRLDPSLADAHGALGTTRWACDWDFVGAESALRRAVALRPGDALLHNWHAWALLLLDRTEECHAALRQACELDPLSPWMRRSVARALYLDRQYARAETECRRALEQFPKYSLLYSDLAAVFMAGKRWEYARAALREGLQLRPHDGRILSLYGYLSAYHGDVDSAHTVLQELTSETREQRARPLDLAVMYTGLKEHDAALDCLEAACEERDVWLPWIRRLPLLDELRSSPRFAELLRRIGYGGSTTAGSEFGT